MKHELISLTTFPTMAAPWSSQDKGETWVWGSFFGTIQKEPQSIADGITAMTGWRKPLPGSMVYHYVMTIFYNKDKNPHGPSSRPVLSIGIEQLKMEGVSMSMPIMIGIFKSGSRSNLGNYNGTLNLNDVRQKFFNIWKSELRLSGEPQKIGTMMDAWGHPQTGWESNDGEKNNFIKPFVNSKKTGLFSKLTDFFS